jgi:hypothetical protein
MSNRSLLEFNHDHCPRNDDDCLKLGRALRDYMRAADTRELPCGVIRKHYRHHSDPCPVDCLPDLLAALKYLLSVVEHSFEPSQAALDNSGWCEGRFLKDAANQVRAALAKAEGGAG